MTQTGSTPSIEQGVPASPEVVLSSAVSDVLTRTHAGVERNVDLDQFAAGEMSPVVGFGRYVRSFALWVLWMGWVNPDEISQLIAMKEQYRQREAANDERFKLRA